MVDVFDGGRRAVIFGSDYFLPSACFGYRMYDWDTHNIANRLFS